MKSIIINLNEIIKINQFVRDIEKISSDIDMVRGHYVVDAKSIMGIMSFDLSKPVEVILHSNDSTEIEYFEKIMDKYK